MNDDITTRAKDWTNTAEYAVAYRVGVPFGHREIEMLRELLAEVERLRYDADWFTKQIQDALDPGNGDGWDADDLIELVRTAEGDAENWKLLWQQNTETAAQAIRERDNALAEIERLRDALDRVQALSNRLRADSESELITSKAVFRAFADEIDTALRDDQ